MPATRFPRLRLDFERALNEAIALTTEVRVYYRWTNPDYRYVGIRRVEDLTAMALLKVHLAWEGFLEDCFLRYMCGRQSGSGYAPILINPAERTIESAYITLLGRARYLNWSAKDSISRAALHFDTGEPFNTALSSIQQLVEDVSTTRNRFAHRSSFAASNFRNLLIREIGNAERGMTPGRFLMTENPAHPGQTFFETYVNSLVGASLVIAP